MSGECAGRLAGGVSAALAFIALIYANAGEVDIAGEASRWCGAMKAAGDPEGGLIGGERSQ